MSKISLAPNAAGTAIFTIESPGTSTNRTLTLPDDTGTIVTNSGNQAGSFTTLNTSGAVVFNDAGADVDFRVEGDTNANLLFVDASTDRVGIGTDSPTRPLYVNSGGSNISAGFESTDQYCQIDFRDGNTTTVFAPSIGADGNSLIHLTDNTERMRITSAGEVLVGGSTAIGSHSGGLTLQRANAAPILYLFRDDTVISTNNGMGSIQFYGNDTTSNTPTLHAYISAVASGTHGAGDNPTDLVFGVTADNTDTVYEAFRIRQDGTLDSQDTYDNTQSGSTVVVTSAGLIGRTSSSIKYKKDVETLDAELVDNAIANLRPVWYRTKDAKGDDKETWSHIGLIAEEVHEVEPRLVRYRTENVEFVDVEEQVTKTREVSPAVTDEEGNVVQEAVTEEYTETVTRKEKQKTPLETPEPEDVDYGRLAVLCLAKIQQQEQTIAALEARIAALETGA